MENYQEYKTRLFESFMDAQGLEKVEYEEVEVEPVFLMSEEEELTEENTAVLVDESEIEVEPIFLIDECEEINEENTAIILENEELTEELLNELADDEKWSEFAGKKVKINKNTGVILSGKFKGKRVNLVKQRRKFLKNTYKDADNSGEYDKRTNFDGYRRDALYDKHHGDEEGYKLQKRFIDDEKEKGKYTDSIKRKDIINKTQNTKHATYKGKDVLVDKDTGVIKTGEYRGKKVNLVKARQKALKLAYRGKTNDSMDLSANNEKHGGTMNGGDATSSKAAQIHRHDVAKKRADDYEKYGKNKENDGYSERFARHSVESRKHHDGWIEGRRDEYKGLQQKLKDAEAKHKAAKTKKAKKEIEDDIYSIKQRIDSYDHHVQPNLRTLKGVETKIMRRRKRKE